jgi:hypothetical protein
MINVTFMRVFMKFVMHAQHACSIRILCTGSKITCTLCMQVYNLSCTHGVHAEIYTHIMHVTFEAYGNMSKVGVINE